MVFQTLVVVSAALAAFQPDCPPKVPLTDGNIVFDIMWPTGAVEFGTAQVFRAFGMLEVNGIVYRAPDCFAVEQRQKGTVVYCPAPMPAPGGLMVSRKIYRPYGRGYIRYYDRIDNPTSSEVTAIVTFRGQLAMPYPVFRQGNGWVFIDSASVSADVPYVGLFYHRGLQYMSDDRPVVFTYDPQGMIAITYIVRMRPFSSIAILNFLEQTFSPLTADFRDGTATPQRIPSVSVAQPQSDLPSIIKEPDLDELSPEERSILWNIFIDTDVNMDGRVNVLDLITVRNDLGKTPQSASNPRCDVNFDFIINLFDLIMVRNDIGWPF